MSSAPRGTLGTVHNASMVLAELARGPAHHQLTDVADRSGMSTATVHRLLRSLTAAGLVEQDSATSRYGLGPALVDLAEQYLARHPVRMVASPWLVDLRNQTSATVVIAVLAGDRVLLLDRIDGGDAGGVYRDTSRSWPAHGSALGLVLAAHDDAAWALVGTTDDDDPTPDRDRWRHDLVVHDGATAGTTAGCIGVVRGREADVVAVVGATPAQPGDDHAQDLQPHVGRATLAISQALGHRP